MNRETTFCPYCGHSFVSKVSFCPYCGHDLPNDELSSLDESLSGGLENLSLDGLDAPSSFLKSDFSDTSFVGSFGGESARWTSFVQQDVVIDIFDRMKRWVYPLLENSKGGERYELIKSVTEDINKMSSIVRQNPPRDLNMMEQSDIATIITFLYVCRSWIVPKYLYGKGNRSALKADFMELTQDIKNLKYLCPVYVDELEESAERAGVAEDELPEVEEHPSEESSKSEATDDVKDVKRPREEKPKSEIANGSEEYASDILPKIKDLETSLKEFAFTGIRHLYQPQKNYWDELDGLIGLPGIKQQLRSLLLSQKFQLRRKKLHPDLKVEMVFHSIFKGAPGTGKTTVARLIAGILRKEGLLNIGCCVEVKASDLTSGWVGFTSKLTTMAVLQAMDGVLFIDEAYSLGNNKGKTADLGKEVIDTLTPLMENYRDRLVVILAGYDDEMNEFMSQANTGFPSRFKTTIHFDNYNAEEMLRIFQLFAEKKYFKIGRDALEYLRDLFAWIEKVQDKIPAFANARTVRSIFETVMEHAFFRMEKDDLADLDLLTLDDVMLSEAELKSALGLI